MSHKHPNQTKEMLKYVFLEKCGQPFSQIPEGKEVFLKYTSIPSKMLLNRKQMDGIYQGLVFLPEQEGVIIRKPLHPLTAELSHSGLRIDAKNTDFTFCTHNGLCPSSEITLTNPDSIKEMLMYGRNQCFFGQKTVSFLNAFHIPDTQFLLLEDETFHAQSFSLLNNEGLAKMVTALKDLSGEIKLITISEGLLYINEIMEQSHQKIKLLKSAPSVFHSAVSELHEKICISDKLNGIPSKPKTITRKKNQLNLFLQQHYSEIIRHPGYETANEPVIDLVLTCQYGYRYIEPEPLSISWESIPPSKYQFVFRWIKAYDARHETTFAENVIGLPVISFHQN